MSKTSKQKKNNTAGKYNPLHWFKRHWWKLSLVLFALGAGYALYLDAQVKQKMLGNTWQLPALIYARPMQLEVKQELAVKELIDELKLLSYRKVQTPKRQGEFSASSSAVEFYRRPFDFADGKQGARFIRVEFKAGRISRILEVKQQLKAIRLEPWLLTRLISSGREDRMFVPLEQVPDTLVQALLLTEDRDFHQHYGIAPMAIIRALIANISAGRAVQGGSTLTQQLAKNLFLTREKSLLRKVNEALMSLLLELGFSKQKILEAYINEIYLGQDGALGVHGFGLASHFYFDRPLSELNTAEIATMVAIIKGPSYYNPRRYTDRVTQRRNLVLRLMFEHNQLDRQQYQHWVNFPLQLSETSQFAKAKFPAFMDKVRRELAQVMDNPQLRDSGIRVFTTLDPIAQQRAEQAVIEGAKALHGKAKSKNLQAAMLVTDIDTGAIRAMVGSSSPGYKGFNRVLDMRRAIGSVIKPAIYLTALEQAASYNLATPLDDKPISLKGAGGKDWRPQNADKLYRGQVSLVTALSRSLNVPTVRLGMELGLIQVAEMLQRLGVKTKVELYPALTLGAVNLSPLEVNQMYQTMANNGRYLPLHSLAVISDASGQIIWQNPDQASQVVDPQATYLLNYALHMVTREGTARSLKSAFPGINMAGKTGTTDDYRDSWFSGYDKEVLVTSWVGRDDNKSVNLTGAAGALNLYTRYQQSQQPKSLSRRFPVGLEIAHFYKQTGQRVAAGCPGSISVPAITDALAPALDCRQETVKQPPEKSFWDRLFGSD